MLYEEDMGADILSVREGMELCRKRPVIYSDLDHLKKGSTGFLHELGYSKENIALALDLGVREVENNLKGRDAGRPEWQCHPVHS